MQSKECSIIKLHRKRIMLAEGGEVPHLRGLIEFRVLILFEIGLVFSVVSLIFESICFQFQEREGKGEEAG